MNNIDQLVDGTLNSLDGIQRATANPFLYTRIQQRLKNRYEPTYQRKLMPVLAAALVLFISLNVASYFRVSDGNTTTGKTPGSSIENFATEYNLSEESGL